MATLFVLLVVVAAVSGLLARLLVPGARRVPLGPTLLIGAAGTLAVGILTWFVAIPLPTYLSGPVAVPASVIGSLIALAAWRGTGPGRRLLPPGREHQDRPQGWTGVPRHP